MHARVLADVQRVQVQAECGDLPQQRVEQLVGDSLAAVATEARANEPQVRRELPAARYPCGWFTSSRTTRSRQPT